MKPSPDEKKHQHNFEPGKITRDGFLGDDVRHIHDIVSADMRNLEFAGITKEELADKLTELIVEGRKGMEAPVDYGDYIISVRWQRGMLPCPFGEPGLYPKLMATVYHRKKDREIRYSQLNVHLIRRHGFFEGEGSTFRLDPLDLIDFLDLR